MQNIKHKFITEEGKPALVYPTRLGPDHEIIKTTVSQEFDASYTFTHTVTRQKLAEETDG